MIDFIKQKLIKFNPDSKIQYFNLSNNYIKNSIDKVSNIESEASSKPMYFVDGGLGTIFESNGMFIYSIKISCAKFENNKFTLKEDHNFKLITYLDKDSFGKLRIFNKIYTDEKTNLLFNTDFEKFNQQTLFDKEKYNFKDFDHLKTSGSTILRLLELIYIGKISNNNGIIIRDGSFEIKHKIEQDIITKYSSNSTIVGISKNSNFIDQHGYNLSNRLLEVSKDNESNLLLSDFFGYQDFLSEYYDQIKVHLIKLHKHGVFFRIDILTKKDNSLNVKKELNQIRENSKDNALLGYPFGLVFVDQLARVANRDSEYEKINLLYKDPELKEKLENLSYNKQFHAILDNMQY